MCLHPHAIVATPLREGSAHDCLRLCYMRCSSFENVLIGLQDECPNKNLRYSLRYKRAVKVTTDNLLQSVSVTINLHELLNSEKQNLC